jgi:ankyrin repeat protein
MILLLFGCRKNSDIKHLAKGKKRSKTIVDKNENNQIVLYTDLIKYLKDKDYVSARFIIRTASEMYINNVASTGESALSLAIENNNTGIVEMLINKGAKVRSSDLVDALEKPNILDILLEKGVDPNSEVDLGTSVLMKAIEKKQPDSVRKLIAKGADINYIDPLGEIPLSLAISKGYSKIFEILLENEVAYSAYPYKISKALLIAATLGYSDVFNVLINVRERIDYRNAEGINCLMIAILNNHDNLVELIIKSHALSLDTQDISGDTALIKASMLNKTNIVNLLLKHGADINIRGNYGQTALIKATIRNKTNTVRLLLRNGADKNIIDSRGYKALNYANSANIESLLSSKSFQSVPGSDDSLSDEEDTDINYF